MKLFFFWDSDGINEHQDFPEDEIDKRDDDCIANPISIGIVTCSIRCLISLTFLKIAKQVEQTNIYHNYNMITQTTSQKK